MEIVGQKRRRHVLVVDDEKMCREVLSCILEEMECDVTGASDGYEALQEFGKKSFDLVMTDLNMNGMDGWRLAREIRNINRTIPIVLVTGADRTGTLQRMKNSSINKVIFKPFHLDDIFKILNRDSPNEQQGNKPDFPNTYKPS